MTVRQLLPLAGLILVTACGLNEVELGQKQTPKNQSNPAADGGPAPAGDLGIDPASCSADGWCKLPPVTGVDLRAVWVEGPNDILVVGDGGTILRFDGTAWSQMASGTTTPLNGVAKAPGFLVGEVSAYAVGQGGLILRRKAGGPWKPMASGTTQDLLAVGPVEAWAYRSVWAVGRNWSITTYDPAHDGSAAEGKWEGLSGGSGASYTALWSQGETGFVLSSFGYVMETDNLDIVAGQGCSSPRPNAIWGTSETDVHVVGSSGFTLRYDGTGWTELPAVTDKSLHAVWGAAPNSVYAAGQDGILLRFDGAAWKPVDSGVSSTLRGMHGQGGTVIAVGDGGTILRLATP